MTDRLYLTFPDGSHSGTTWPVSARGVAGAFRAWAASPLGTLARIGVPGRGGDDATIAFCRLARFDAEGIPPSHVYTAHTVDGILAMSTPEWREPR